MSAWKGATGDGGEAPRAVKKDNRGDGVSQRQQRSVEDDEGVVRDALPRKQTSIYRSPPLPGQSGIKTSSLSHEDDTSRQGGRNGE